MTPPPSDPARDHSGRHGTALQILAEIVAEKHVRMLGTQRAADQRMRRLAGADARRSRLDRRNAGTFLAHEGARRAGHLVDDRNVAGEQVGELRQEQCRPQLGGQLFVEQHAEIGALRRGGEDGRNRRPRHARRRRRRSPCPWSCTARRRPSCARRRAPGRPHRCRAAARFPSGAGRRAWGSAGPSRFREADGSCRADSGCRRPPVAAAPPSASANAPRCLRRARKRGRCR